MATSRSPSGPNMENILTGLASQDDAARKMASFKLQSLISDPSYVEAFAAQGGLLRLRNVILDSSGNTLAYSLASFARILETDHGWDAVNTRLVQKVGIQSCRVKCLVTDAVDIGRRACGMSATR